MQAFQAAFAPSKLRRLAAAVLTGALLWCVWQYHTGSTRLLLLAATLAAAVWAWRGDAPPFRSLSVNRQGQASLTHRDGSTCNAVLLPGSLISPYACFLKWQIGDMVCWQCILPDMLERETWRRMTVWARFGQKQ